MQKFLTHLLLKIVKILDKEKYIHEWNGLEHVTYIPFIFPAGMFIDEGHHVCKLENLPFVSKRKTFVYKNKIDGLSFYFNIRITRYNKNG